MCNVMFKVIIEKNVENIIDREGNKHWGTESCKITYKHIKEIVREIYRACPPKRLNTEISLIWEHIRQVRKTRKDVSGQFKHLGNL